METSAKILHQAFELSHPHIPSDLSGCNRRRGSSPEDLQKLGPGCG